MKKLVLFTMVFLLISLSLFSIAEDQKLLDRQTNGLAPHREYFNTNKKTTNTDHYRDPDFEGYGYNAYDPTGTYENGPIYFAGSDPTSITLLAPTQSGNFIAGACWIADEETWYGSQYGGGLYTIDHTNGNMTYIGNTSVGFQGIEYDDASGLMYGTDGADLYTIDWTTGATTLIGSHNVGDTMIGIGGDGEGNLYGVTVSFTAISDLYLIDLATGNATSLGSTGGQFLYAQDLAFDKDAGILYSAAYFGDGTPPGLYEIDINTCAMTGWGDFPGGMEVTGFAIPYTLAEPGAPAAPGDLVVTPDGTGGLSVDLSWTNPDLTFDGDPLTELLEMRVYRNDVLIYTDDSPTIGGASAWTDNTVSPAGMYTYDVVGYNSIGEGPSASEEVWVGEDVPNAVTDLALTDVSTRDLMAQLDWTNPTEGMHGGYFPGVTGYLIERINDGADWDIPGPVTQWTDDTITDPGIYSYSVVPYNNSGTGPIAYTPQVGIGITVVEIGNAETLDYQIPMNIWYENSLVEVVYHQEWIGTDMLINAVSFHANISSTVPPFNFEIWMGENNVDDLTGGWIDGNDLLLVYDGLIDTPPGEYWLDIPLDTPFEYTYSDNLVLLMIKDDDEYYSTSDTWYTTESGIGSITLHKYSDTQDFDAFSGPWDNPQSKSTYPDIRFYYSALEHGDVEGVVTNSDTGDPVVGAEVWIGSFPPATTDASGYYLLEDIVIGTHSIFCNLDGYYLYESTVDVLTDQTITHDITLEPNLVGTLDGTVTDATSGNPLVGATIHAICAEGYEYTAQTNNSGYYIINDVVAFTYDVSCSFPMYPPQIEVGVIVEDGMTTTVNFSLVGFTYFSDFEATDGGLIGTGEWQWGTPSNGPGNAYSGVNLWGTNLTANYQDAANYTLDSPQSYQLGVGICALEFWHYYDIESYWDGGNVKISTNEGGSWELIYPSNGDYPEDAASTANSGIPGEPCYSANSGGWVFAEFDLSAYSGENVMFRFHFGSDGSVTYPGWFIDDVSLSGGEPPAYGALDGYVYEYETRDPIQGAAITCGPYSGTSDNDGYYLINGIATGSYDVTCTAEGYVDAVEYGVSIFEDTTTELDFELMWSEIAVDPTSFDVNVPQGGTLDVPMSITNDGPGELTYSISFQDLDLLRSNIGKANYSEIVLPALGFDAFNDYAKHNPKLTHNLSSSTGTSIKIPDLHSNLRRNIAVLIVSPDPAAATAQLQTALAAFDDLDVTVYPLDDLAAISGEALAPYDVVIAYNDYTWEAGGGDATTVGDAFADYIDLGGTVIDNMYLHSFDAWGLGGRFIDEQYSPFTMATTDNWNPTDLGTVYLPDHPVMTDVTTAGQTWGVQDPGLAAGADLIADWNDGNPFLAANNNVVGMNIMPIDPNVGPTWTGDVLTIYYNAIVWLSGGVWVTADPSSGSVPGESTDEITIHFNAGEIPGGTVLEANMIIVNNSVLGEPLIVPVSMTVGPDGIEEEPVQPLITALGTNFPNPFNPVTNICYSLRKAEDVTISIYNIKGQRVKTLVNENMEAGRHTTTWYGKDNFNRDVSSGVYFYKMEAGKYTSTKKMILMK